MVSWGIYIATKYILISFLPEKWFGDSSRLIDMANNVVEGSGSYAATAAIYSFFPLWALDTIVTAVGTIFLYAACQSAKSIGAFLTISIILLLSVPQTLLVPNKETLVILMTLAILYISRKFEGLLFFGIVLVLYISYGVLVRNYYLLIIVAWIGLKLFYKADFILKFSMSFVFVFALILMPVEIMQQMQGQRDAANEWAIYVLHADNRTAFFNPFAPVNFVNFSVNYIYSFVILNIPLVKWWTMKEVIFTIALIGCFTALRRSLISRSEVVRSLGLLFFSHLLVLCTFEPDLGSYFRHFTSVLAYLFPAFSLLGARTSISRSRMRRVESVVRQNVRAESEIC